MKKDKAWLKSEVENILYGIELRGQVAVTSEGSSIYYAIEKKIDELDEPEVLSQEFIDEHEQCITGHGADKNGMSQYHHAPFVSVYDLQNLLVPKQEIPVVPQFVADYIEECRHIGLSMCEWFTFDYDYENEDKTAKWLYGNDDETNFRREFILIDAIRYGYEVEKEPVYYAKIKGHELVETETILDDDTGDDISEFCRNVYFVLQKDGQIIVDMKESCLSGAKEVMTMSQWNDLGINETNADFEEVE